uniref:Uncharacterized protein n=1 Tax=Arundo donax TaxID=35708 RepID=A0A0A8ZBV2_ARUDO
MARLNEEMARRNDRAGVAAISMFAVTILLIVAALFSRVL